MKLNITRQPRAFEFTILGITYTLSDLTNFEKEINLPDEYQYSLHIDRFGNYVLVRCELFPCFDFYDNASENRFFRRYMVCKTEDEAMEKYKYCKTKHMQFKKLDSSYANLAPIIFADDTRHEIEIMSGIIDV